MKVEVWEGKDSISVFKDNTSKSERDKILDVGDVFIRLIEGKDWTDCMKQHHEIMGWKPYKPF